VPAFPYYIAAQLLLIAASAAVVKSNRPAGTPAPKPAQIEEISTESAVDPDLLARAKAMPSDPVDRFGVIEDSAADAPPEERSMGFDAGANEGSLLREFAGSVSAAAAPRDEPPPVFAPVEQGRGYHISSDAATNFDLKTNTVVFTGNVSLKCADFSLKAARLVVHMDKDKSLEKLVANGAVDVHLTGVPKEEAYRGQSEQAVFDPRVSTITLTGWPKITGQDKEHIAATASTRMILHTQKPKLETEGRASTRLAFDGENGMPGFTMGGGSAAAK
jgi:lipopolysaccharide transport protein LptA